MTAQRQLKSMIRDRQARTGESYTAARVHVMRDRAALLGLAVDGAARADAVVLRVNDRSARVRLLGEDQPILFRSRDAWNVVPGPLVTLVIERRWSWRGHACASGAIEHARIDVTRLGLEPLPLTGGDLDDLAETTEPFVDPDPFAPRWRELTAVPRPSYRFDPIAWGALAGRDPEDNLVCDAAELAKAGDFVGARELLMDVLVADLRCLDAHAHLGNLEFKWSPARALVHDELGIRIGELSLPAGPVGFDGLLPWGVIYNRPFLRCLHGSGLCLWRLGRLTEAEAVFARVLALNPTDNQGARFCWADVRQSRTWSAVEAPGRS